MSKENRRITAVEYARLPSEYRGFIKPDWGVPYIVYANNGTYNLNNNFMLNSLYAKLNSFSIEHESTSNLPAYFQTLENFICIAKNQTIYIAGVEIDFFSDIWEFKSLAKSNQSKTFFIQKHSKPEKKQESIGHIKPVRIQSIR